jgi:hypothetical protein
MAASLGMGLGMALAGSLPLQSQATSAAASEGIDAGPRVLLSSGGLAPASALVPGQVIREIDDPFNGARWLLVRDEETPAGPRRLLLVESGRNSLRQLKAVGTLVHGAPGVEPALFRPVIRAGDRLVVEENTAVVEARLEAVALGPAAVGSPLEVRLRIGGRVVRAVALAPGRAALAAQTEGRP